MAFEITAQCSGCNACIPSCPAGAIRGLAREVHEIDPAKCIDCGACGVVCPDEAVRDPRGMVFSLFEPSRAPRAFVELARCTGCGWCVGACSFDAIQQTRVHTEDGDVITVAAVDPKRCTGCDQCVMECGVGALAVLRPEGPEVTALRARNAAFVSARRVARHEVL